MASVIPFLSRIGDAEAAAWLKALNDALPEVRVTPLREVDTGDRASARVAVVADPDPLELDKLPSLVWVQSLWAGVERILRECPKQDLAIARMEDPQLARTMAEAVLAWTLYLHREMPLYARQQRDAEWEAHPLSLPQDITVGVLGLGALGASAADLLRRHGFRTIGWSRTEKPSLGFETHHGDTGLQAVLAESDILVVLLPLTAATERLLDAETLDGMRPGASMINFARGPIIDDDALLSRLSSGRLKHAVLDVFDREPLPTDSPFWSHPSVTVLPHISAPTTIRTAAPIAAANIRRYLETGDMPKTVDRRRGY